ncbi:PilZ domain-containing protein [Altererythrobacter sp. MF3-039]|jgi:hypothetical protein|uniref:PilZ domain-containing protein n=1 Tax=Altererythrobacter sp. MF3-039 TaxID=3252901 RepID=UPI00390C5D5E
MILPDDHAGAGKLKAKLRNSRGGMSDIVIHDLSAAGCMVDARGTGLRVDDRVLLKLQGLEFQPAYVLWKEDDNAGLTFERILSESVYEHLQNQLAMAKAA